MATEKDLFEALRQAEAAGNAEDAAALSRAIVALRRQANAAPPEPTVGDYAVGTLKDLARQTGLTARAGARGLLGMSEMVTEPLRMLVTDPLLRAVTGQQGSSPSVTQMVDNAADAAGLPTPATPLERVAAKTVEVGSGAAGLVGGSRQLAKAAPGLLQEAGRVLSTAPGMQVAAGAGAGAGGQTAEELGLGGFEQLGASALGGVAAGSAVALGPALGREILTQLRQLGLAPHRVTNVQLDQLLQNTLRGSEVSWERLPDNIRARLRLDVRQALQGGHSELNPAALERLAAFRRVPGSTPTRGSVTLDPVHVTREKNLAKTGANSMDTGLQRLAQLENANNAALVRAVDDAAGPGGAQATTDSTDLAAQVIRSILRGYGAEQRNINQLYAAARDSAGRSAELDPAAFTQAANRMLDERMVGGALPTDVANRLNQIARGEMPLNVEIAEQLKTHIGNLQRSSSDGNARVALGIVREALDNTPLRNAPSVNPGNLPAVAGTVPQSPAVLGQEAIDSFNAARRANAGLRGRLERQRMAGQVVDDLDVERGARQAIVAGQEPSAATLGAVGADKFLGKYLGSGTLDDARQLHALVAQDPEALAATRRYLLNELKTAAVGAGQPNETAKFSSSGFRKQLSKLEPKLKLFFDEVELDQLRAIERVASYVQHQPAGSAVNNSNSGALLVGKALDLLTGLGSKIPGLSAPVSNILQNRQQSLQLSVPPALRTPLPSIPMRERAAGPLVSGSLLATPSEEEE